MARLVDFGFTQLNECFDALPTRVRLAVMVRRFDEYVANGGWHQCCRGAMMRKLGDVCDTCREMNAEIEASHGPHAV